MQVTMTLHRTFLAGKLCFDIPTNPEIQEVLKSLLTQCREKCGDYVSVTLQKPGKPRTTGPNSQNHHLNGHIMQICNETGNDYETVKYCIKMLASEQLGYPNTTVGTHTLPKRERDCTTEECAKLIEASHLLAADLNIVLKE